MVRVEEQPSRAERDYAPGDYVALQGRAVVATAHTPDELHERLARTSGLGIEQVVVARVERLPGTADVAAVRPEYDAIIRATIELEKQFPPPSEDELFADARWFRDHLGTGELEPYRGTHVAVLNGAVVGHARDPLGLELEVARRFNVHPQRVLVEYVWPRL